MDDRTEYPHCFGDLDIVFPMGENGLRNTPESCMICLYKTECLKEAMAGEAGLQVREEKVDRAYASGVIGFMERWSSRKELHRRKKRKR
ncbi:MAG: hypothetical protein DRH32_04275 [Deltaproteobacteria bacterium]|nr:MAG: hypothetical protein DRH32_04275 [Deltaproteobacteria bacterium]